MTYFNASTIPFIIVYAAFALMFFRTKCAAYPWMFVFVVCVIFVRVVVMCRLCRSQDVAQSDTNHQTDKESYTAKEPYLVILTVLHRL